MTNQQAIRQLTDTAAPDELMAMLRAAIAALIARGAKPEEIGHAVDNILAVFAECERIEDLRQAYWQ